MLVIYLIIVKKKIYIIIIILLSLGSDKPQLSCIRITAMLVASNRLWIGTGIGVIISVPLLDSKFIINLLIYVERNNHFLTKDITKNFWSYS